MEVTVLESGFLFCIILLGTRECKRTEFKPVSESHIFGGCEVGKSAMSGSKVESKCPENCLQCFSNCSCQRCHTGYWGVNCSETILASYGHLIGAVVFVVITVPVIVFLSLMIMKRKMLKRLSQDEVMVTYSQMDMGLSEEHWQEVPVELSSSYGIAEIIRLNELTPTRMTPEDDSNTCDIEIADEDAYGDESVVITPKREESVYESVDLLQRRVPLDQLRDYVANKTIGELMDEFESLPTTLIHTYEVSQREENLTKNRYRGIFPYDKNRVVLAAGNGDYINASYIDGHRKKRAYIACLGPTEKQMLNFAPFWEMVWQENINTIVMLTNLLENGFAKCEKYWPDNGHAVQCGKVLVLGIIEDSFDEYVIRTFIIKKLQETRVIRQIHFTVWPDKGVPALVSSIVHLQRQVRQLQEGSEAPLIVHCSAGVGRTGTFIALDILTDQGMSEGYVDIYACVRNLREQRVKLVQTIGQYRYLHLAVAESLLYKRDMSIDEEQEEQITIYSNV